MEPSRARTLSLRVAMTRALAAVPTQPETAGESSDQNPSNPLWSDSDVDGVADMVQRARADPQSFGELYDAYFTRIYGYVAARVRSPADAEDAVADTFVRALDKLPHFEYRGPGSFVAWLFRIARNRVLDEHAKRARLATLDPHPDVRDRALDDPAADVEEAEAGRVIRELIRSLPPRRQEVVALRFFGGLRNREIAEVIGVDQRTVASHLCRALDELRTKYEAVMRPGSGGS
jgi:RNA polymerase sigma-70 factor (ECF subfamily)